MTNKTPEQTLRDRYFENEIFRIGELVEDCNTGEQMKILDRGSNYLTVATHDAVVKKWLYEVKEIVVAPVQPEIVEIAQAPTDSNFELLESGQIKLFGYETKNFDADFSTFVLEQFLEFDDLYSKHQIIKCLDLALDESDSSRAYDLLERVNSFYSNHKIQTPYLVEGLKTDIERRRIAEILATVAGIDADKSNYTTVVNAIKALKAKFKSRQQWEVLWPFLKLAKEAGLSGILANLPYTFGDVKEDALDDLVIDTLEDHFELLVEDIDLDDVYDTFAENELSEELLSEVLSLDARTKMARKIRQHTPILTVKRERALNKAASASVLLDRARRLAETMIKRRIFHKAPTDMSRQEKERFEAGASKRKALVAKLAQRLVGKVRALQSGRLHHTAAPASHVPHTNVATGTLSSAGAA